MQSVIGEQRPFLRLFFNHFLPRDKPILVSIAHWVVGVENRVRATKSLIIIGD